MKRACWNCLDMRAEQWIADQAMKKSEQPFFLYLPLPSPHTPHVPRKPFQGKSDCGVYGDYVVEHDWSIGRVYATLERLGIADNTLVVVTSDNGAHMCGRGNPTEFDFERDYGHRSNHIYRGQKSDAWDGGHRVPFFAAWPDRIKAGSRCDTTVCLTDMLATAAEITGTALPDDAGEDSVSMMSLMAESDAPSAGKREAIIHHGVAGRFTIRRGKWKFIEGPGSGGWSLPDDQVPADASPYQLYNVEDDPEEMQNLYDAEPEVVKELQILLDQYREADRSVV